MVLKCLVILVSSLRGIKAFIVINIYQCVNVFCISRKDHGVKSFRRFKGIKAYDVKSKDLILPVERSRKRTWGLNHSRTAICGGEIVFASQIDLMAASVSGVRVDVSTFEYYWILLPSTRQDILFIFNKNLIMLNKQTTS